MGVLLKRWSVEFALTFGKARGMARARSGGHERVHARGGSGGSEVRLGCDCGWRETRRVSWSIVVGHVVRTWREWMWLCMLAWPWPRSSDMDPTSLVSFGLQADSCEEDASLDADCFVVMLGSFCLNWVLHRICPSS